MRAIRVIAAAFAFLVLSWALASAYDEAVVGQAERAAEKFRADLTLIEKELLLPTITDAQLTDYRGKLEDIRAGSQVGALSLVEPVSEVNQQITLLGPAPTSGKTEAPAVAAQREALTKVLNRIQGAKSQLELVAVTAEQLASRASALQRNLFLTRIFEGGRSVLNPRLWLDTGLGIGRLAAGLAALYSNWWADVSRSANFAGLALIPVFVLVFTGVYLAIRGRLQRWITRQFVTNRTPDDIGRLWRVIRAQIATFAVLLIFFLPVWLALDISGFMTPRFEMVFMPLIDVVFVTAIYWVIARRVASPGQPQWRIVDLDEAAAARLPVLVGLTAFVAVTARSFGTVADGLYLPVSYTVGQSALSAIAILALLSFTLLTVRNQQGLAEKTPGRRLYFGWARSFVPLIWLLITGGALALLTGYVALANYIAQQLFETAILVTVLYLLHHLTDAAVTASFDPQSGFGRFLRQITGLGERGMERLGIVFRTIVDLLLLMAGLPLLFILWTVTWIDFRNLFNTAVFGFKIGNFTLSPSTVFMVLLVIVGGIIITNLLVRWLDRRILAQTRLDRGVQDSLRKGASYAGYVAAAGMGLSAAGLDFSNIAIIAGALGVGIGFGLQSIVNNFISGLILLAERPIRVGDWVVLDAGQGLVKRINVRSTEIETFESCSIIVPNLMLITGVVKNWTHGDTIGQFMVAVTVDLASDADLVRKLLLETARQHPKVMTFPEPGVTLARIAATGLDFELRGSVADIFDGGAVASDIRFSLLTQFREKAITIPQPLAVMQAAQK